MDNVVLETEPVNQYGLISQARAEKFDLLGKLILNQREAVVVCGCEGIGKTTFLKKLKKLRENLWIICLLQGDEDLTLAEIQKQLAVTILQQHFELLSLDVEKALAFCQQRQHKVVLLLDDAAALPPGLINSVIEYALQHPILRPVFALTKEQLNAKTVTDKALDDGYFMEIPPLTLAETNEFVQNLPLLQNSKPLKINRNLVNKLYRYTAGVPGDILVDFPLLLAEKKRKNRLLLRIVGLLLIVTIGVAIIYFRRYGFENITSLFPAITAKLAELTRLLK